MKKRVLFDWDGTIVDSMDKIFQGACHVFVSQSLEPPSFEDYVLNFRFPFGIFYRERGVKLSDNKIYEIFLECCSDDSSSFFDDALPAFSRLQKNGFTPTIITANSSDKIVGILNSLGLAEPVDCVFARNKASTIAEFVKKSALGSRTPYFGDIREDMREAVEGGASPVAVLRKDMMKLGQEFLDAGAIVCIKSLRDLELVLR